MGRAKKPHSPAQPLSSRNLCSFPHNKWIDYKQPSAAISCNATVDLCAFEMSGEEMVTVVVTSPIIDGAHATDSPAADNKSNNAEQAQPTTAVKAEGETRTDQLEAGKRGASLRFTAQSEDNTDGGSLEPMTTTSAFCRQPPVNTASTGLLIVPNNYLRRHSASYDDSLCQQQDNKTKTVPPRRAPTDPFGALSTSFDESSGASSGQIKRRCTYAGDVDDPKKRLSVSIAGGAIGFTPKRRAQPDPRRCSQSSGLNLRVHQNVDRPPLLPSVVRQTSSERSVTGLLALAGRSLADLTVAGGAQTPSIAADDSSPASVRRRLFAEHAHSPAPSEKRLSYAASDEMSEHRTSGADEEGATTEPLLGPRERLSARFYAGSACGDDDAPSSSSPRRKHRRSPRFSSSSGHHRSESGDEQDLGRKQRTRSNSPATNGYYSDSELKFSFTRINDHSSVYAGSQVWDEKDPMDAAAETPPMDTMSWDFNAGLPVFGFILPIFG